nr:hypothetical protein [Tanacetum cinerariifolium]
DMLIGSYTAVFVIARFLGCINWENTEAKAEDIIGNFSD